MTEFKPRPYQQDMIDHIKQNKRCALFADMGMGKTVAVLTALESLDFEEQVYPALVIAPLRVANSTWPDEITKWDHLGLRISPVTGNKKQRKSALAKKADIYAINYEQLPWLVQLYGKAWPFKTIIADELTRLKSFRIKQGSQRAKALAKVAHRMTDRFIGLTGTPSPNGLIDIWGQMWFIDEGYRLGRTFTAFRDRWFQKSMDGYSFEPLPHAQPEIESRIKDVCLSVRAEDHFDLEKPITNEVTVDLPNKARSIYDDMERNMFAEIEQKDKQDGEIEAFNAAARTMKCLQLANGAVYDSEDSDTWYSVHEEKIRALDSIITEANGAPVIVAYNFRTDLYRLQKAFPQGKTLDHDPETINAWNHGEIPILFTHPASAGHGLNLADGGNRLVFFSLSWNLEEHQQIIERIGPTRQKQAGYSRPVYLYYIMARKTVDAMVRDRLFQKKSVQDILLEAMSKENTGARGLG